MLGTRLLLAGDYGWVLLLFFVAGFTDGLDGYLAKRFDWRSRLCGILDPLADKLLLVCTFVTLGWLGWIPLWLVVLLSVMAAGHSRNVHTDTTLAARQVQAGDAVGRVVDLVAFAFEMVADHGGDVVVVFDQQYERHPGDPDG